MQAVPAPPAPPQPPTPPGAPTITVSRTGGVTVTGGSGGPAEVYRALKAQGEELRSQLENLNERRESITEQLREERVDGADRTGLQTQLTEVDARIASVNKQIAANEEAVAQAAGVPGAVVEERPPHEVRVNDGPPAAMIVTLVMTIFVLFPITLAYARRLWKRPVAGPAAIPPELFERMARLEQAVDSVAIEVERIGEGQRFVTKLFAESPQRIAAAELPQQT